MKTILKKIIFLCFCIIILIGEETRKIKWTTHRMKILGLQIGIKQNKKKGMLLG
jgi:hypothetical protein